MNRFCGIVLKRPAFEQRLPRSFQMMAPTYYVESEHEEVFDGFQLGHYGSWAAASLKGEVLTLSRDRIGIRTIYYVDHDDYFCFSNAISSLKKLPFLKLEASKEGAFAFFFHGRTDGMFAGVQELKAGAYLKYNLNTLEYEIHGAEKISIESLDVSLEEASIQTRNLINQSVQTVLEHVDQPAAFLSGGIDSSVIASAVISSGRSIPYLTAMTGIDALDEVAYAQDVVGQLEISEWHQIQVGNVEQELINLHHAMELPTTSLGSFMQYELMRFCQFKGIRNVLDGTGADALYGGHNYYNAIYWNELILQKKFSKLRTELKHYYMKGHWLKYYAKNLMLYYYIPRFRMASKLKFHLKNNPLLKSLNRDFIYEQASSLDKKPEINLRNLNTFLKNDFFDGAVTELLRFTDRIGKYFGVMSQPIFCQSPELYQHALGIPSQYKVHQGLTKFVLRNAYKEYLPKSVLTRRNKMGLVAPNNKWMKDHKEFLLSFITPDLDEYFQVEQMKSQLSEEIEGAGMQENYKAFRFLSFALWHKTMLG
ncbi:asparagine synthase-related protein [Portibacter marinus]|uniref:asparagine synthase-related protein n=1 Tax=Portibacter marinus TaxID=2898660 RepID=UPI001F380A94|nr:asparagine synthase-related protein [Portibacter marinus]